MYVYVCVSVCLSVCMQEYSLSREHLVGNLQNFLCLLPVAEAQSSSDSAVMLCTAGFVDVIFSHNGLIGAGSASKA